MGGDAWNSGCSCWSAWSLQWALRRFTPPTNGRMPRAMQRVWNLLFSARKHYVVHSYLYHSHIVSLLFKAIGYHVIWSIHSSVFGEVHFKVRIVSWLSHFVPDKIMYWRKIKFSLSFILVEANEYAAGVFFGGIKCVLLMEIRLFSHFVFCWCQCVRRRRFFFGGIECVVEVRKRFFVFV